jgi:hypothetical protein
MLNQTDQSAYIVIGISLIVTAIAGWLAYLEYGEQPSLEDELSTVKSNLQDQQETVQNREKRLQKVSDRLGWKDQFLYSTTSLDESGELETGSLQNYPSIESLEEDGNLLEETRRIMQKHGFPEERINEVTADAATARQFLNEFYLEQTQQLNQSLTSLRAMGANLDRAVQYVVPALPDDGINAGALGEQYQNDSSWSFTEPSTLPSRGSINQSGITYRQLLEELSRVRSELFTNTQNLTEENEQIRQKYFSYVQGYGSQAQVPTLIEESRNEIQNLEQQVDNLLSNLDGKRNQLINTKAQVATNVFNKRQEKSKLLDQQTQEVIAKKKQIIQTEDRLERLESNQQKTAQDQVEGSVDGQVLSSNSQASVAFIDLGRQDGLFTGQAFEVFNSGKGGREILKGEIKVTKLFDRYARTRILSQEQPVQNPIQSSDYIRNDDFIKGSSKTFVLAGQFSGKNDEPLLREIIQNGGHELTSEVTINTSYLVIGSNYDNTNAYKKAQELSVTIISPAKLRQMLDRQ